MIFLPLQLLPFSMRYPEAEQGVAWRAATLASARPKDRLR